MSHHLKRILIMFSVALNLGFIITASVLYINHPPRPHQRYRAIAHKTIEQLNLPPAQYTDTKAYIKQFEDQLEATIRALHQSRTDILLVLSKPGALDQQQYEVVTEILSQHAIKKRHLISRHLLQLRQKLGDEKGAQFFAAILAKVTDHQRRP